jgi:hypothetical protein
VLTLLTDTANVVDPPLVAPVKFEFIVTVIPTPVILTKPPPELTDFAIIPFVAVHVNVLLVEIVTLLVAFAAPVNDIIVASTSNVTVWVAAITTASAAVGTTPPTQVPVADQFPVAALVIVAIITNH